jgi:hypothetical protein
VRKKIIFWLAVVVMMVGWPVSLITDPPKIQTGFVWQMNDAQEEKRLLLQKLGLDTSRIKKIFYNSKTTIMLDRYTKNVLTLMDLNNYFFAGHPQVGMTDISQRMKFPYVAIIGFLAGVYISIKKKKYFKLWLVAAGLVLFVSFFKKIDGWDVAMYPLLGFITIEGLKEINKYKLGWLLLLLIAAIGATEIGRLL